MAGSYVLPQLRVFQEFVRTPNDVTQNLNPFLIGPSYQLMRFADEGERADCTSGAYAGASLDLDWAQGYTGSRPDKSWCSVTMADAYVALGEAFASGSITCLDEVSGKGTKFEFSLEANKSLVGTDATKLHFPVSVKVGDYLAYQDGSTWKYTKIREISCGKLASGEVSIKLNRKSNGANAASLFTVDTTQYTGEKAAHVLLHAASNKLTWSSDVAGVNSSSPADIVVNTAITLGAGLKVTPKAEIADGDYVLTLALVEPYSRDTVTVADFVPTGTAFTFVRRVDSADVVDDDFTVTDAGVTVESDAKVDIGLYTQFKVVTGTAYLNQRNFRTDHIDGVYTLGSEADILRELGAIVPENPLAYAAHIMLLNSASQRIRYIGVESDDLSGYVKALERASVTNEVYAFCPLTEDAEIIDTIVADCKRLSTPDEKSWRISFFSKPTEEATDVTPNVYGTPETCKVVSKTLTCYSGTTSDPSEVAEFADTVRVGDVVTVINTAGVAVETTVAEVVSNNTLTLADTVASATSANCRFTIQHKRARAEYVAAIAATSAAFKDRRAYNVFPNNLRASDGNYVSGMYAAAAVCALACSVPPQQPITNVEIKGFTDLPDVYSKFSRDELNTIAAGGTLIVMQDKIGGEVYVRHQISTAYSGGDLNSTELSLVKNLDSISYYFANRFAPYIGRYNLTDDLLTEVRGILEDGLAHLETTTETNKLIGPQVIADGTEIRSLYRDPDEKDKAYADVALNLPEPFNNFDLHLQVI